MKIVEVETNIPINQKREIVTIDSNGIEDRRKVTHCFLKITLKKSKEVYALDLSGAQFGYYNPVIPWLEVISTRYWNQPWLIDGDHLFKALGSFKAQYLKERDGPQTREEVSNSLNKYVSPLLVSETEYWEEANKLTMDALLKLPQQSFEIKSSEMVGFVAKLLDGYIVELKQRTRAAKAKKLAAA